MQIIYTVDVQVEPNSSPITCTCAKVRSLFCVLKKDKATSQYSNPQD